MTDEETIEEKAIEYVLSHKCTGSDFENSIMYESYLDGLTEGKKEKWHDLRKNPEDFPKENGDYWCKLKDNRLYTFEVYYTDSLFYKAVGMNWVLSLGVNFQSLRGRYDR